MEFRKSTLSILCVPLAILFLLEIGVLCHLIKDVFVEKKALLTNYKWMVIGIISFMIVRHLIIKLHWPFRKGTGKANLEMIETFMHELTHQIVALFLGRRLHSFYAEQHSGVVYTSGSVNTHLFVALAPYCLPWLSLIYVIARVMIKPEWIWLYDLLIGLSLGFNGVCIFKDTRHTQPDINQYPLFFSFIYIATFLLFNLMIILICIGKEFNIVETLRYMFSNFWEIITSLLK